MHTLLINRIARGLQDADKEPLLPENTIQIRGTRGSSFDRQLVDWARRKLSMAVWFMEDQQVSLTTPLNLCSEFSRFGRFCAFFSLAHLSCRELTCFSRKNTSVYP